MAEVELKRSDIVQLGASEPVASKPERPKMTNLMQPYRVGGPGTLSEEF